MAETTPKSMPDFDPEESDLHNRLGNPQPTCPPLDILLAYAEDVLPAEHAGAVRLHLTECRLCPLLLADLATLPAPQLSTAQLDRIRTSLPAEPGRAKSSSRIYAFIGIAAALLLAIFIGFSLHSRSVPPPSVASITPPTTPPTTLDIPISPLAPPQGMLTRGADSSNDPAFDKLMPAFAAYNAGDYAAATQRFTQLHSRYPHSETVALYLGISQLLLHQDAQAYTTFTSLQHPHFVSTDALRWYTAVAAERTHAADAPQLFADICASKTSRYSAESCRITSQLTQSTGAKP